MNYRVCKNGEDLFLKADGTWGKWEEGKKCKGQDAAEAFAHKHGITVFGLFPVSKHKSDFSENLKTGGQ